MERARAFYKLSFNNISKVVWVVGTGRGRQDGDSITSLPASRTWHTWVPWEDGLGLEQLWSPLAKYLHECSCCANHRMVDINGKSLLLTNQAGITAGKCHALGPFGHCGLILSQRVHGVSALAHLSG